VNGVVGGGFLGGGEGSATQAKARAFGKGKKQNE
jgi:hypothetical protein